MKQVNYIITILLLTLICQSSYAQGVVNRSASRQTSSSTKANQKKASSVKVSEPDGYINGHGYVDLGLPSGTKWATCNVGASSPEGSGDYFAWGEIKENTDYKPNGIFTFGKDVGDLKSEGVVNSKGNLAEAYDAASCNWKGAWHTPSKEDFEELINKCKWKWIEFCGIPGFKVASSNGRSIFLPAVGYYDTVSIAANGIYGHYWSSTICDGTNYSYSLNFHHSTKHGHTDWIWRYYAYPIRPVSN